MTTRRIKQIDQAALEISNNHFDVVLDTKGHDELSSLSSHINTMSSNLKNRRFESRNRSSEKNGTIKERIYCSIYS